MLVLVGCAEPPRPTPAQQAADICRQGGLPPGSDGYAQCFSQTMAAMVSAQGQRDAIRQQIILQRLAR